MTIKEAHERLPFIYDEYLYICNGDKENREAIDVAINVLGVIPKIKQEIDEKTEIHQDGKLYIKNIDVQRIINKYLEGEE